MTALRTASIDADFQHWTALLELIQDSFCYMDGIIDPPSSAHLLNVENLKAKARDELGFAAFVGEYLAGCVFIKEKADHFYLGKLAVAPAFEGQGIGRQLLEKAEHQAVVRSSAHFDLIESDRRPKCLF